MMLKLTPPSPSASSPELSSHAMRMTNSTLTLKVRSMRAPWILAAKAGALTPMTTTPASRYDSRFTASSRRSLAEKPGPRTSG